MRASPVLDSSWAGQAQNYADLIAARIPEAAALGVDLSLVSYPVVPALHGFVVGSGELFLSFCWWDSKKGVLAGPRQFYDHFGPEDQSDRAQQFRALFGNWLRQLDAAGDPVPPPSDGPAAADGTGA